MPNPNKKSPVVIPDFSFYKCFFNDLARFSKSVSIFSISESRNRIDFPNGILVNLSVPALKLYTALTDISHLRASPLGDKYFFSTNIRIYLAFPMFSFSCMKATKILI